MRRLTIAAALVLAALSSPSLAQSPTDHDTHQGPGPDLGPAPAQSMPPAGQPGGRHGMMGGDMMGKDMMRYGDMDHDDMGHEAMGREDMMGREDRMGAGMTGRGMMMGRGMAAGARGPSVMFRMIFALMDADGDGTVSLVEFQAAHERIFRAMDSNKDGKLTQEEMQAFMRGSRSSGPQQ
jgi:EF hand